MRLRRDSKVALLATVPLLAGLSKKELTQVAQIADEMDVREGTELIREGERGREFIVLVEGTARVTRGGRTLADLKAGGWLGEIALLCDVPRTASVVTTSPTLVLVVTDRAFRDLVQRMPSIAVKVLASVGERLARDEGRA
jgi:CRP-like cAMP-binding protein